MANEIINEANWVTIYDNRLEDLQSPIKPIELFNEFYRHTIRVTVTADKIPQNWVYAGYLIHRLTPDTTNPYIAETLSVTANVRQLFFLKVLTDRFYLDFRPMQRYLWMNVKIDYYTLDP